MSTRYTLSKGPVGTHTTFFLLYKVQTSIVYIYKKKIYILLFFCIFTFLYYKKTILTIQLST